MEFKTVVHEENHRKSEEKRKASLEIVVVVVWSAFFTVQSPLRKVAVTQIRPTNSPFCKVAFLQSRQSPFCRFCHSAGFAGLPISLICGSVRPPDLPFAVRLEILLFPVYRSVWRSASPFPVLFAIPLCLLFSEILQSCLPFCFAVLFSALPLAFLLCRLPFCFTVCSTHFASPFDVLFAVLLRRLLFSPPLLEYVPFCPVHRLIAFAQLPREVIFRISILSTINKITP